MNVIRPILILPIPPIAVLFRSGFADCEWAYALLVLATLAGNESGSDLPVLISLAG